MQENVTKEGTTLMKVSVSFISKCYVQFFIEVPN